MNTSELGGIRPRKAPSAWALGLLCFASISPVSADVPPSGANYTVSGLGLSATVFLSGGYQISAPAQGWLFQGAVSGPIQNARVSDGTDSAGNWHQISFDHGSGRTSSIRLYDRQPVVLFSTRYGQDTPNADPFPSFSVYPQGLFTFNYSNLWSYRFGALNNRAPWLFFDGQANAFVFSPASNFMTAVGQVGGDGSLQMPIDSRIATLPAGFTHRTLLAIGAGINSTFRIWGNALTQLTGKQRPSNDSNALLNQLSYWTDAGAAYYYSPQDPTQYVPQLLQVPPVFAQASVPIGSLELDSWHYPKGSPPSWTSNGSGMASFLADPTVFPQGLAAFQKNLGIPLITHARWIDAASPLRTQYNISGNVAVDPKYWQDYANYMVSADIGFFEQDWLSNPAVTDFNLTDPDAFLDNMASALGAAGRQILYCMPLSTHILQSAKYDGVFSVRVGNDALRRGKWDELLFDSPIPSALGLWPFADAFVSANVKDVLLATLTAGPIASGDAVGSVNSANLSQAVRADGVIVKPDAPIVPTDATFLASAQSNVAPIVASTYTDHGGSRTAYVLAYERTSGALGAISFLPQSMGVTAPAYVFDYFQNTGTLVAPGVPFTDTVDYSGSYYIVAPVGPSGIAFLGDSGKFVSSGKKRIEQLSDDGAVHVVVRFAPREKRVVLHFYSVAEPVAIASEGHAGRAIPEAQHRYTVDVSPGPSGTAVLDLRTVKKLPARPKL
ncbi:MAG TPA: hypothetical protein VKX49_01705 [Bryobacteraceae bacterium]|nr:hypothetical protein [Bryobacteraceae bacterium]